MEKSLQRGKDFRSGCGRQVAEDGGYAADPTRPVILDNPLALLGQAEQTYTPVGALGNPLDQTDPLQAIGQLGHGAKRDSEFPAESGHGARLLEQHSADPQLRQGQIIHGIIDTEHLPHQLGQDGGCQRGLLDDLRVSLRQGENLVGSVLFPMHVADHEEGGSPAG